MAESSTNTGPSVKSRGVTLLLLVLVAAFAAIGATRLQHDDDVLAFLPPKHPDVLAFREVADRFGMLEVALVGLRADGEDLLTTSRTEEVRALAKSLSESPGVRLVLSFPELPDARVEGQTLVVEPLVPKSVTDATEIRQRVLGNFNAVGNLIDTDGKSAMLMVYLLDTTGEGAEDLGRRAEVLEGIRTEVDAGWRGEAFFGGAPYVQHAAASASRTDIERLSPIVVVVLVIASALLLRSLAGAVLNLVITGLGVAIVLGGLGWLGHPLSIVSSTLPVMMVALGGAFGMHMIAGYQRQRGTPPERAQAALAELRLPVILSGVTTAASFLALVVMPQVPMRTFGVIAAVAMIVLLGLALFAIPRLLAMLPPSWLPTRAETVLGAKFRPPLWAVVGLAVGGLALVTQLEADPDTRNVFDEDSEVHRADQFLADNFGGSQFVQIAIDGDLTEPTVLRKIRTIVERLRGGAGIGDVRSLIEPVALLTEGFGGRAGVPSDPHKARRVITNLADQDAMAQLMTRDQKGAIIHVKLATATSDSMVETTAWIRSQVEEVQGTEILVVGTEDLKIARIQREHVRGRVERLIGRPLPTSEFIELLDGSHDTGLLKDVVALRTRAFGTDEVIEPLEAEIYEVLDPEALLKTRGKALEALIRTQLPSLVAADPEGAKYVAEQLGQWLDEAIERRKVRGMCERLGLPAGVQPKPAPTEDDAMAGMFGDELEAEAEAPPTGKCGELLAVVSELDDAEWERPADVDAPPLRSVPIKIWVTGQPLIGQAFAQSVTVSLLWSTLVSIIGLSLVLLVFANLKFLVPALWTIAVTAGVVTLLGHPISIGTSMVACIALGAGIDFAIHLGVRARANTGDDPGGTAVAEIGGVVLVTGVQLAAAFLVLLASEMPPLRQFGAGLAIGLLCAAAGAVWLIPVLFRRRR